MLQVGNINIQDKVLVVAEIGNNHEGKFDLAQDLVRKAADCGVDAVKFQTFKTGYYVSRNDAARYERLKSFELSSHQFESLSQLAHSLGILFISTPFDLSSAECLIPLVDAIKISSGDNNFYPLLEVVARAEKPLIVSTGLSDIHQVRQTVNFIQGQWANNQLVGQLALLHCVTSYPVPSHQANLRSIPYLSQEFPDLSIGYSDHTLGIEACFLSVALGARIIEKHFTLDKNFSNFRDHQLSADPCEMKALVEGIYLASTLLGSSGKETQSSEASVSTSVRRSIVAGCDMPAGHMVDKSDLTWIRPGGGLPPGKESLLIGKVLTRNVSFGEPLRVSDVK